MEKELAKKMYDCIVVGGGAAGMMAAILRIHLMAQPFVQKEQQYLRLFLKDTEE